MSWNREIKKIFEDVAAKVRAAEAAVMRIEAPDDKLRYADNLMKNEHLLMALAGSVPQIEKELCAETELKELCEDDKLSVHSYNYLKREGFDTQGQVALETEESIKRVRYLGMRNFWATEDALFGYEKLLGMRSFGEVKILMEKAGLKFNEEEDLQ